MFAFLKSITNTKKTVQVEHRWRLKRWLEKDLEYLRKCWKWSVEKKSTMMQDAELHVERIPAITFCEDCRKKYKTVEYGKKCPHCGSENTYLLQGNEFNIKEIEVA